MGWHGNAFIFFWSGWFMRKLSIVVLAAALWGVNAVADELEDKLRAAVDSLAPGAKIEAIAPSPVDGLYEVVVGSNLWYITKDGKFLIDGDIYDVAKRVNISAAKQDTARAKAVDGIGEENMIVFSPENPKYTVSVFTDIDCGYCRKLHREIKDYTDAGIEIRYLMYPRAGVDSPAYNKAVASWCANDRKAALTKAKAGQPIEMKTCDSPIKEHMAVGESLGITGTPTMVLESGRILPGYVPAKRLRKMLDAQAAAD
jgi:thiol:disulfide interchange protein DsbC